MISCFQHCSIRDFSTFPPFFSLHFLYFRRLNSVKRLVQREGCKIFSGLAFSFSFLRVFPFLQPCSWKEVFIFFCLLCFHSAFHMRFHPFWKRENCVQWKEVILDYGFFWYFSLFPLVNKLYSKIYCFFSWIRA